MHFVVLALLLSAGVHASVFVRYPNQDITPCVAPCQRVGNCGYGTGQPTCNITLLEALCRASKNCVAFNSNGWLKGCGNTSCGASFEPVMGTDSYIRDGGVTPVIPVAPVVDSHYPPEELAESQKSVVVSCAKL